MADYNGQVNTNVEYDSYFWVRWAHGDVDIANNKTKISWACGVTPGHMFGSNAIKMSAVTINGVQVYGGGTYSNFTDYQEHTLGSGVLEIPHNPDGTKTFTISPFTGWLWEDHNYSSNGGSFELPAIPRKATITAAYDFNDQQNPVIYFDNPGGLRMDVWLEPNPVGDHLCERESIPNTGSYTWSLTDAERDALRNKCPGNDCTIRLGLYSYAGNTQEADYQDKKFTMTENTATKPSVNINVSLNNGSLDKKFDGMYIQGKSRLDIELSASGKYGASIQQNSYSATVGGKTYYNKKFTSDVIRNSGSVKITGRAKDSRQFTGSAETTVNFVEYSKPLVFPIGSENAIQCYRSDANGNRDGESTSLWLKANRFYYGLNGKNKCRLYWRYKLASEAWDDGHEWRELLSSDYPTNDYNASLDAGDYEFHILEAYTIQVMAEDDIGERDIKTLDVSTRDVALHLGKGGKNVAVGTYCDTSVPYTFYSEWDAIFNNDVYVGGNIYIGENKTTLKDYIKSVINGGG